MRLRLAIALLVVAAAPVVGRGPVDASLARLTDTATSAESVSTAMLRPPTSLAATGGSSVVLGWTATVDGWASGYDVLRATVSGGPYSVVSSVSPSSTTATTDSPASSGTYYYVLRSVFQNWTSVNSNQASAVVTGSSTSTGYHGCTPGSNAADTGGDGNGYEATPANACAADGTVATDANSGTNATVGCTDAAKDRHRYSDFNLGVPATVVLVSGIQVRAIVGLNNNSGSSILCVQLSPDAGVTWTTPKSVNLTNAPITSYTLGAVNDTWGRTWLGSEFANALFRVRVIDASDQPTKDFRLDYVAVQVTYAP